MGSVSNFVYAASLVASSLYVTDTIKVEDIEDFIDDTKVIKSNPYDEVLLVESMPEDFTHSGVSFRKIPMDDIDSWEPYEILAKMMYTERVNPVDDEELRLIAATAIHMALFRGKTIRECTLNKKAYSGVMRKNNKRWMSQPKRIHLQVAYDMVERYKQGIPNQWADAMFFCNEAIVKAKNPKAWKWFKTLKPFKRCVVPNHGTHTFYSSPKFEAWKGKNPAAKLVSKHLK